MGSTQEDRWNDNHESAVIFSGKSGAFLVSPHCPHMGSVMEIRGQDSTPFRGSGLTVVPVLGSALEPEASSHRSGSNDPNGPATPLSFGSYGHDQIALPSLSIPSSPTRPTFAASSAVIHSKQTVLAPVQKEAAEFESLLHRPALRASQHLSNASSSPSGLSSNSGSSDGTANTDRRAHPAETRERLFSEPSGGSSGSSGSSRSASNGEDEQSRRRVIKQRLPSEPEDLNVISPNGKRRSSIAPPSPEEGNDSSSVHAWDSVVSYNPPRESANA